MASWKSQTAHLALFSMLVFLVKCRLPFWSSFSHLQASKQHQTPTCCATSVDGCWSESSLHCCRTTKISVVWRSCEKVCATELHQFCQEERTCGPANYCEKLEEGNTKNLALNFLANINNFAISNWPQFPMTKIKRSLVWFNVRRCGKTSVCVFLFGVGCVQKQTCSIL